MSEIDLKDFINDVIAKSGTGVTPSEVIDYLEAHDWFDYRPDYSNGKVMLIDEQAELFESELLKYLCPKESITEKFHRLFPDTAEKFDLFLEETAMVSDDLTIHLLVDFLAYHLRKELVACSNTDTQILMQKATTELAQSRCQILIRFIDWTRSFYRTKYTETYRVKKRAQTNTKQEAYDINEYLTLAYYLFNQDYIDANHMWEKAAKSKDYTDTWLHLAMHFICSIRYSDLKRIYHPTLPKPPEVVLSEIATGTFSDADAIRTLKSITNRFEVLPLTPSKTSRYNNIEAIKLHFPISSEILFGRLFAAAEAHSQIAGTQDEPIIRKITSYKDITKNMGEEIGNLFLYKDFSPRSANKSYLQAIEGLTDDILGEHSGTKGYILASHARSHKGNVNSFISDVTSTYLEDGKFKGMSLENIAFQYIERGVLSAIVSYLLKLMPSLHYDDLSDEEQTQLHSLIDISPLDAESTIAAVCRSREQARAIVTKLIAGESEETLMTALERIVTGTAFSKRSSTFCLQIALGNPCANPCSQNCIGCGYEILTKSTLFYLISEYKRMKKLYQEVTSEFEKNKWRTLALEVVLPKINEMLTCLKEYPEDIYKAYEEIIREEING